MYEPRGRLDPAGFAAHIHFRTYAPSADLTPFIVHGWTIRWASMVDTYASAEVMHRPYVDLFVSQQQSGIQGTFRGKRTYRATGSGRIVGVRFRPGAFHAFWLGPMAALHDTIVDIQQIFPHVDSHFIAHLLAGDDQAVITGLFDLLCTNPRPVDPNIDVIDAIIRTIETDVECQTVRAVAHAFGRSERWLQQLFRDYLGIGLKWLIQRHRLVAAVDQIRDSDQPDWAGMAYDLGYSSQQHFITAFKHVVGKTPLQYHQERAEY